jgi:hypothetical protein
MFNLLKKKSFLINKQGSIHFCNCQQLLKFLFYQNYELEDLKEEEVLKKKRMEAKQIYKKFQALAKTEQIEDPSKIY